MDISKIDLRFQSGNSVPVERAYITAVEWKQIKLALSSIDAEEFVGYFTKDSDGLYNQYTLSDTDGLTKLYLAPPFRAEAAFYEY